MENGGNSAWNEFQDRYQGQQGVTDQAIRYTSQAAELYREKIDALAAGRQWVAPPPQPRQQSVSDLKGHAIEQKCRSEGSG
ncbi:hypothetical protein CLOM_g16425 [Closterium sp. NIES-68]|nr:hypothetical protein CLOM_g16425 [Closterium sp. NIES-68]GJP73538.1 hypothetical protein CLOP_g4239 [Closterium sp. NIES-67]